MYNKKRHIHFVGIGGIGMSGIAEVLLTLGHRVSGSDLRTSETTSRLAGMGALVQQGHDPRQVRGADVVVVSSAVKEDNEEVRAAREAFIPVIPRAEMLAELMRLKYAVLVAGSHGKTTTTSLVGEIMAEAGMDPTMVIGGKLGLIGSNARLGKGEFLVAEADESDGSFLMLTPTIAVVTNIDLEHLDYYRGLDHLKETFLAFINRVPFYGRAILNLDDANTQALLPGLRKRYLTYGFSAQADIEARDLDLSGRQAGYELYYQDQPLGPITLNLSGRHNVSNSLAAASVALELGLPFAAIARALAKVSTIHRRLEVKGEAGGVTVIDDYGHHPTEIRATLAALKASYPASRVHVFFQPHRYTRTQSLFEEFATAFNEADTITICDIYAASERPIEGVNAAALVEAVKEHGHREVHYTPGLEDIPAQVAALARPGDVALTLGAGSVSQVGDWILKELGKSG